MTKPKKTKRSRAKKPKLPTLYKVLVNGRSCHGGDFEWSLPKDGKPGKWHEIAASDALVLCSTGFHLTDADGLHRWWMSGAKAYEVEVDGEIVGALDDKSDRKVCARRVRVLREVDEIPGRLVSSGEHEVRDGVVIAYGSATVTAYGSATVTAYGSATVTAYDSATVTAYDSATVTAYDSATVTAYDSATVRASGSATVRASGSATVTASHKVVTTIYWGSVTFALSGSAVCVDQRGDVPALHTARDQRGGNGGV